MTLEQHYLIALGSNKRHVHHGLPRAVLVAAMAALVDAGLEICAASAIVDSQPLGPSIRRYANAAIVARADLQPEDLLSCLKQIERAFGRRRGQRWSARVLDLDIVLWSGGCWASKRLIVPHPHFRMRPFVTGPAAAIAPNWRDPLTGLTTFQLNTRLTRPRALPSGAPGRPTFSA